MIITPSLFEAFLKCATKSWLRSNGEPNAGNDYAAWVQIQDESYRADAANCLIASTPADERAPSIGSSRREEAHFSVDDIKTAKWRVAAGVPVRTELRSSRGNEAQTSPPPASPRDSKPNDQSLLTSAATIIESRLPAVERIPSEGRGNAAQFVPIRFIFRNKLTKEDKLLLAFDALVLGEILGRAASLGKIIHGDARDCARSWLFEKRTTWIAGSIGLSKRGSCDSRPPMNPQPQESAYAIDRSLAGPGCPRQILPARLDG